MARQNKKFNILAYLPVGVLAVSVITGYVKLSLSAEDNKTKVSKVEEKIETLEKEGEKKLEEVKKDNQEIDKSLTEMRVQQTYIQRSVDDLNENLKELLQEIKEEQKEDKKSKKRKERDDD